MLPGEIRMSLYFAPWRQEFEIYIDRRTNENTMETLIQNSEGDISWASKGMYESNKPPVMVLSESGAQHLMETMWRAGIRPSEVGTVGALQAAQSHISDLRTILFHREGIAENFGDNQKP